MSERRTRLSERGEALKAGPVRGALGGVVPLVVAVGIALLLHFVVGPWLNAFNARMLLDIGVSVILAVSLTMVNGFTGQFSMGHAAFMAVGAYVAATLVYYGSARMLGTQDFADANAYGGVLSTTVAARDIDVVGGKLEHAAGGGDVFVFGDAAKVDPARSFDVRLADDVDDQVKGLVRVAIDKTQYEAGDRVALKRAAKAEWFGQDVRLMKRPRMWSRADSLFLASLFAGGLGAAVCGYLVGLPSLRLRGDYLAIVTLGFGEIVRVLIQSQTTDTLYDPATIAKTPVFGVWQLIADHPSQNWAAFFHDKLSAVHTTWQTPLWRFMGGPVGFTGVPSYTSLFWVWLFAVVTLVVAYRLKESSFGRAFLSIREDEIAAEAMGVKTTRYKVQAFVIAAFFAGVAGGLYAHTIGIQLNAGELGFMKSFDIIIMVVLGGMGSISGAAIAAAILTVLPEVLRDPPSVWNAKMLAVIGVAAVLMAVFSVRKVRALVWLVVAVGLYAAMRYGAQKAHVALSDYRMVLYSLALILMMILRPQGLFGVREIWNAWRVRPLRAKREVAAGGLSGEAGKVPVE